MKNRIIKLLGGITKEEYWNARSQWISKSTEELEKMRQKTFRVGDVVYINGDKNFDPTQPYYLLQPYGGTGGACWYVSTRKDDPQRRELVNGVLSRNITHDPNNPHP